VDRKAYHESSSTDNSESALSVPALILPLQSNIPRNKLEILVRKVDDDGTIIQPSDFIPVAERYNLMPSVRPLGRQKSFEAFMPGSG
jgi:EAL domain-containing protein (putative c-di-GMP-specific phosphodiesterase class I)